MGCIFLGGKCMHRTKKKSWHIRISEWVEKRLNDINEEHKGDSDADDFIDTIAVDDAKIDNAKRFL